jgi:hypothetical protein
MDAPESPQYTAHSQSSSREAILARRETRRQQTEGPDGQIQQLKKEIETLKRNQANDQAKIADMEEFRRGMSGDENIKVADNRITWVGRAGGDGITGYSPVVLDVCVNGEPKVSTFLYDGFRDS